MRFTKFAKKLRNFSTKIIKKFKQFYKSLIIIKKKFLLSIPTVVFFIYLCSVKLNDKLITKKLKQ